MRGHSVFHKVFRFLALICVAGFLAVPSQAKTPEKHWVASWATAVMNLGCCSLGPRSYVVASLRQIVHVSIGGHKIRLHLSNAFNERPLHIAAVHVARAVWPGSAKLVPGTDVPVTFDGKADVILPAMSEYISDPVDFDLPAHSNLAITILYDRAPVEETGHSRAHATAFLLRGKHLADADLPGAWKLTQFHQLASVDVLAPASAFSVVALGDSITDGHGSTLDANARWPDVLAARLTNVGVLNLGIGGGRVLNTGNGPSALARFNRDVLAMSGVKTVIVMEGINDLGVFGRTVPVTDGEWAAFTARMIGGYKQLITRAHAAGIKTLGATMTPYRRNIYYHASPAGEAARQKLNAWIRAPGHFDGVVDFDKLLRDRAHPGQFDPAWDLGDHIHPSDAGYARMGKAIDPAILN